MKTEIIVISLGGSMIVNGEGIHLSFLQKLQRLLAAESKKGFRFHIIAGGGNTARVYQKAGRVFHMTDRELDIIGIAACRLNGEFLRAAYKKVPGVTVVFGGKPGESSDGIATRHALSCGAKHIVNISNTAYVYSADPKQQPDAKKFETLTWSEYKKIVGSKWVPGMHAPFDPTASRLAARAKISVAFMSGDDLSALSKILNGRKWNGSCIQ